MIALLVALILLAVIAVLAVRLRRARRRARTAVRKLAMATGHPSASGMSRGTTWHDRRALADAAADRLAGLGMVAERRTASPIVRARGAAGDYELVVLDRGVVVDYIPTIGDRFELGEFGDVTGAVREIAAHADLPAPV